MTRGDRFRNMTEQLVEFADIIIMIARHDWKDRVTNTFLGSRG